MTNSTDLVLAQSMAVPAGPSFRELVEYHYARSHLSLTKSSPFATASASWTSRRRRSSRRRRGPLGL